MSSRTESASSCRRSVVLLALAAALATAGTAAPSAGQEQGAAPLAREALRTGSGSRHEDRTIAAARAGSCPVGTAAVRERAVIGRGQGKLCITVGRGLTGSTHVDPHFGDVSSRPAEPVSLPRRPEG